MKQFKLLLTFLISLMMGTTVQAAEQDMFTVSTIEGVAVTYFVTDENIGAGTGKVQVRNSYYEYGWHYRPAISQEYLGPITIPSSVSRVVNGVTVTYTVTQIAQKAFLDCSITKVTLPSTITLIDSYAFSGCSSLDEVVSCICPNTRVFNPNAFPFGPEDGKKLKVPLSQKPYYVTYYWTTFFDRDNIEEIPLPGSKFTYNGITYQVLTSPQGSAPGTVQVGIGGNYNQQAIDASTSGTVEIPQLVTYTSDNNTASYSFNVTKISQNAFNACQSITSFILPSTIVEISDFAMSQCYSLRTIELQATTPPMVGEDAFSGAGTGSSCVLIVPVGTLDAYQTNDSWNSLFKCIKEKGYENVWRVGDVFNVYIDYYQIPFRILSIGETNTVQLGRRLFSNTSALGDNNPPSVFNKGDNPSKFTVPETVEYDNTIYTVTAIGAYALSIFTEGDIELPGTITTIGYNAFNSSCWPHKFYCNSTTPPSFVGNNIPFQHYVDDETGEVDYAWNSEESTVLYVPDGCTDNYSGWNDYFYRIVASVAPVTICGQGYSRNNPDLFGDGTASLMWEYEEGFYGGDSGVRAPRRANVRGGEDEEVYKYGYPVLTLDGATIEYGNGPAIEVNSVDKFYIRVKGANTITTTNAAASISIGTAKDENMSPTSLIILNDEDEEGGIVIPVANAPRHKARKASTGNGAGTSPSLTITNSTADGDGIFVYQGSCNVKDCDVTVTGQKYGLEFGVYDSGIGYSEPTSTNAPRRNAKTGPKKVTPLNGPVDAEGHAGYMNVYEDAQLKLRGDEAALWGATWYYFGEGVSVYDSDKSTYEENYSYVDDPYFYSIYDSYMPYGTYVIRACDYDDSWHSFYAKYLRIGIDKSVFTEEVNGVPMTFKITDEENNYVQTYGYYYLDNNDNFVAVPAIPLNSTGVITIPETVTYEDVTYTVTAIGEMSFSTTNIEGVTIPSTITNIGEGAFYYCTRLTSIAIPNSVSNIEYYAFQDCSKLSNVTLGSGLKTIGEGVFYDCIGLTSITIPASVNSIGECAFQGCTNLVDVIIENGVRTIGEWAFYDCGITSITIPSSVTSINNGAFSGCPLQSVYVNKTVPIELPIYSWTDSEETHTYYVFDPLEDGQTRVLYVPAGCVEAYQASDWWTQGGFSSIVEMDDVPATVPVTISVYAMATFCSTQPLNFTNVSGLKAYIVSGFNPDDNNLTLTRVYGVPAGTGLVLYGNAGEYDIPVEATNSSYANMLVGCTEDVVIQPTSTVTVTENGVSTDITYTNFVLSVKDNQPGFYRFYLGDTSGRTIEAGKAYLRIPTDLLSTGSSIKGFKLVFSDEDDDIITGIGEIEVSPNWSDDDIYNLSGQRLNKAQKGVNIMNGKKVLVK